MKQINIDKLAKKIWDYHRLNQELQKANCILVMGSHDTRVTERGAKLFLDGWAPLIIFSGGFGRLTNCKVWPEIKVIVTSPQISY